MMMQTVSSRNKAYRSMAKHSLRIFVYLNTPMVFPKEAIHLDALLTEVVARELFGNTPDRWQNVDQETKLPLPLNETKGKYPVWKSSIAFTSFLVKEHQDFWVKQTNQEFSGYIAKSIVWPAGVIDDEITKSFAKEVTLEKPTGPANNPTSGGFKSYFEKRNLVSADYLLFHANGNAEEIERLLSKLNGIGKKTAIGFGKINKVKVDKIKEDYSLFTPDNKPSRHLPAPDFPNLKARIIASPTSSPYWSKRDLVVCYAPTNTIPVWRWEAGDATTTFEDDWFSDWFE